MQITVEAKQTKEEIFEEIQKFLDANDLKVDQKDDSRPWGGFFALGEDEAEKFIALFFPHLKKEDLVIAGKLSPKMLLVAPGKRLSWQ